MINLNIGYIEENIRNLENQINRTSAIYKYSYISLNKHCHICILIFLKVVVYLHYIEPNAHTCTYSQMQFFGQLETLNVGAWF